MDRIHSRQLIIKVPPKLRRLTLVCALLIVVGSGCTSARTRMVDTGERGLFQMNDSKSSTRASMADAAGGPEEVAVSFPPNVNARSEAGFRWPVNEGKITSFFGNRKRDYHEGIDIRSNRGTPIYAAKDGEVIYSSQRIRGYGNMVVIKHAASLSSVYAHNRKNLVKVGERVTQGQLVGYVGATGKATGPHVHFEIRKGEIPQDPLLYLPQIRTPAMAHK